MKRLSVVTSYVLEVVGEAKINRNLLATRFRHHNCPDVTEVRANHTDAPNVAILEGVLVDDDVYAEILADPDFGAASILSEEDV